MTAKYIVLLIIFVPFLTFSDDVDDREIALKLNPSQSITNIVSSDEPLPIDTQVLSILTRSELASLEAMVMLNKLEGAEHPFNISEQFLLLLAKANIQAGQNNYQKAINWLNKAVAMQDKLPKKQVYLPKFSQVHSLLSTFYAEKGKYQQAYDENKKFMNRYRDYRSFLRNDRMERLNNKYQTDLKIKENELQTRQQQIKQLKLDEANRNEENQKRNLIILFVTAVIFASLLLRQLRIRKVLKYLAKTDSLTGLFNRRTLFDRGQSAVQKAQDHQQPLSVLMIDIDHFKEINDTYGHDVGDSAIKAVAKCGEETFRSKDIFARIGGEEYAVIMPSTELEQARAIAERYREKVQGLTIKDFSGLAISHPLSISIGVAQYSGNDQAFDHLLHQADIAMYQAKHLGRNRVRC